LFLQAYSAAPKSINGYSSILDKLLGILVIPCQKNHVAQWSWWHTPPFSYFPKPSSKVLPSFTLFIFCKIDFGALRHLSYGKWFLLDISRNFDEHFLKLL
jgi:hypothetical protein